jgi:hypothetical protein
MDFELILPKPDKTHCHGVRIDANIAALGRVSDSRLKGAFWLKGKGA